mgnify:CR=1 FL=1
MKALIWIIALVLAIPTFGISLAVAVVITIYLNKQDQIAAAHIVVAAVSTLKNDIVNKYYRLRMREELPPSSKSDSEIFDSVMKCCTIIEGVLKEGGRFHDDKDDVIQLAVRLTSYSDDLNSDDFIETLKGELVHVAAVGVLATLRKPYRKQNDLLVFDDDIPF